MGMTGLVEVARQAGLLDPRAMPFRQRTGEIAYKVYYGPLADRRELLVPANASPEDVRALIAERLGAS